MKLPTYKEIKALNNEDLKDLYWKISVININNPTDIKVFNKLRGVTDELCKRDLAYFDGNSYFHWTGK
ncbi:hypothetical protein [Metabacillus fastidiosus]|uniref:hypothetical protein n=1 Tax=Metabacillus fastidiosus TaxID=1458 RepID=UPI003D2CB0DF